MNQREKFGLACLIVSVVGLTVSPPILVAIFFAITAIAGLIIFLKEE